MVNFNVPKYSFSSVCNFYWKARCELAVDFIFFMYSRYDVGAKLGRFIFNKKLLPIKISIFDEVIYNIYYLIF